MTNPETLDYSPPDDRNLWERVTDWWYLRRRNAALAKLPITLQGTIDHIIATTDAEELERFAAAGERDYMTTLGHFAGMGLRNRLGLWEKSQPLVQWFRLWGLWHADDLSAIIYRALWLRLNGRAIDMTKERDYYEAFWKRKGIGFDGVPIPGHPGETARSFTIRVDDEGRVHEEPVPEPVAVPTPATDAYEEPVPLSRPLRRTSKRPGKRLPARKRKATRRR